MKLTEIVKKQILKEGPDYEIYKKFDKISDAIFKLIGRYAHKVDINAAIHTWMTVLHSRLKKQGYKVK